jgi:hypothetical protein
VTDIMDMTLSEMWGDSALVDRVVRTIDPDDRNYHATFTRLLESAESATISRDPTIRGALSWACAANDTGAADRLRLLEQGAKAVKAADRRATKKLRAEKTQQVGPVTRVLLDTSKRPWISETGEITRPRKLEKRLARARAVDERYHGVEGREAFLRDDASYAAGGVDLVRTLERPIREAKAAARVAGVADDLRQLAASADGKLMLDGPKQIGRQLLKGGPVRPSGPAPADDGTVNGDLDQRVRQKLVELELPESAYARALESVLSEEGVR